ncbi:hypothetical protein [Curtobacterium luteum]|uniref:hypothetical protein n=1 Tax=Curtobacterium luteum TaxID=33881 RepID=UPI003811E504
MQRWRSVRTVGVAGLVGVVVTLVGWWRLGPVAARTVWAEDGGVFWRDRAADGPLDLLEPYAGYLHLLPRLLVDVAWVFPVAHYAVVLSLGSCLVVGGAAALVSVLARDVVRPWPLRALLAAVPALLPLAPVEIAGNAANLHWYLLALAPWVFAHRPRRRWSAVGLAAVAAAVTLTEPQTVLFLPLLLLAWVPEGPVGGRRVGLRPLPVTVVAVLGVAAQLAVSAVSPRRLDPGVASWRDVVAGWFLQPFGGLLHARVGDVVRAVLDHGWAVVLVPAAAVGALLVAAVVVGPWRARVLVVALTVGSVVVWAGALWVNGADRPWSGPAPGMVDAPPLRYGAASGLLLLSAVATAAGVLVTWGGARRPVATRPGGAVRLAGTALGWCAVAVVVGSAVAGTAPVVLDHEPQPSRRADGPEWAPQVVRAAASCRADPSLASVRVETAPWGTRIDCARLR